MSDESKLESFKYALLKAVDISGFRVFDPVVRLLFGEEPSKQISAITRFMVVPMCFVGVCVALWTFVAPRHKTKSGEVPKPSQVWQALVVNDTLHKRETEKDDDFQSDGEAREARIEEITALIAEKKIVAEESQTKLTEVQTRVQTEMDAEVAPIQSRYDELKATNKKAKEDRLAAVTSLSDQVAKELATQEQLLDLIRQNRSLTEAAREEEKAIKEEIDEVLGSPPKELKQTQLAADSLANEIQHLNKRLDYLGSGNRSVKVEKAAAASTAALASLDQSTAAADISKAANKVVLGEEKAKRYSEQKYPRGATIWFQVRRSLFTVFVGFVLAAAIAIPVGIMCGLSPVAMACLTPIISIFKPVSPVVWLLIFQIVVGAFFPNPDTHPLFVFCSKLPFIGNLGVNPALVFSACTVAMCAVWPALVNTALGVSSVDPDHINVAKVLKLGLWSRLTKIIIPSSLPLVFAGLRISLGVGWMVLIAAEALSSSEGLGKFVWDEYQNGSSHSFANIIFACFVVGIIGFFLDRIMIILQRSVSFDDGAAVV